MLQVPGQARSVVGAREPGPIRAQRETTVRLTNRFNRRARGSARRRTRFEVRYADSAVEHLRGFSARERGLVLDTVIEQLSHEPTLPTRNRKLLRANPVAPWELRIADIRVYFDVAVTPEAIVTIRAVGRKERERVLIGGVEVELNEDHRHGRCDGSARAIRASQQAPRAAAHAAGRPYAALMPISTPTDLENLRVNASRVPSPDRGVTSEQPSGNRADDEPGAACARGASITTRTLTRSI